MGGEDSRRRAEAATFAWSTLQKTVREYPVVGVLLAVAAPLLGAAGIFLLPFALPLAIGLFVWSKQRGAQAEATAGSRSDAPKAVPKPRTVVTIEKAAPAVATPPAVASTSSRSATSSGGSAPTTAAPLTGSAALMARMRKSGAVTGEKRAADPASIAAEAAAKAVAAAAKEVKAKASNGVEPSTSTSFREDQNSRLFFLYGGEASTQIARNLAESAAARGLSPRLVAMDDFKRCELDKVPAVAVFIVETIENAQPAEAAGTCLRFYNRQRKKGESGSLNGKLRYAVLGLGDTNLLLDRQTTTAKDCNQAAQTLDSALNFLGAERVCQRGEANDAVGLEEAVEPWTEQLWAPLSEAVDAVGASASPPSSSAAPEVKFLFGSQTGNAAEICKEMAAEAPAKGFPNVHCNAMNEVDVKDVLKPGAVVVYVVSSTGDGDAPDNCDSFFTKLKRVAKKEAGVCGAGVQYAVLGLGDQNYSAFMAVPRSFTAAMEKAGAKAFYPRGEADDTLGLYEYCEKWQDGLWEPLRTASERAPALAKDPTGGVAKDPTGVVAPATPAPAPAPAADEAEVTATVATTVAATVTSADLVGVPALPACRAAVTWLTDAPTLARYPWGTDSSSPPSGADHFTHEEPYLAAVSKSELMTDPKSDRRVLHVEFDTRGARGLDFEPGDSLGVLPQNDPALVDALAARLGLDPNAVFELGWAEGQAPSGPSSAPPLRHVRCPASVLSALTHAVDVTAPPRKSLLRVLAEACTDAGERRDLLTLCSRGGRDEYKVRLLDERPTLLGSPPCLRTWCASRPSRVASVVRPRLGRAPGRAPAPPAEDVQRHLRAGSARGRARGGVLGRQILHAARRDPVGRRDQLVGSTSVGPNLPGSALRQEIHALCTPDRRVPPGDHDRPRHGRRALPRVPRAQTRDDRRGVRVLAGARPRVAFFRLPPPGRGLPLPRRPRIVRRRRDSHRTRHRVLARVLDAKDVRAAQDSGTRGGGCGRRGGAGG